MKRFLALLFALCLLASLLTACGGSPAPESEAEPETPSSVSPAPQESGPSAGDAGASGSGDTEKKPFVIQSVYDDYDVSGSPDPAPTELLCQYFTDRLSPEEYLVIKPWEQSIPPAPWEGDPETPWTNYFVLIYGSDIRLFQTLLETYDGPWTPIVFGDASYSLSDLMKAELDIRSYMENNRELINAKIENRGTFVHVRNIMRGYEELKRFADDYPIPELFLIEKPEEKVIDYAQIREYS